MDAAILSEFSLKRSRKQRTDDSKYKDKDESKLKCLLPPKRFEKRRSLITELIEDNVHVNAGYNIIISFSTFIMIVVNLKEYRKHGRLSSALVLIYEKFGKLDLTFLIWIGINIITFMCFYCFMLWAKLRRKLNNKNIWDTFCVMLMVSFFGIVFYIIPWTIFYYDIPFASTCIIMTESIRMLMKIHAFVRGNAPKVLVTKSEKDTLILPSFSKYLQFLYVPTLVYSDNYPRSGKIRWSFILHKLLELAWMILCMAHIHMHIVHPIFKDTCHIPITISEFSMLLLENSVPSILLLWLLSTAMLDTSQNAVGEIIHFGDRMTHSDWWNVYDIQQFYKKWNWIIGDWLYTYINKDLSEVLLPGKRNLAKLLTILVSALAHEWLSYTCLGFFCPIVITLMMISFFLVIIRIKSKHNVIKIINMCLFPLGTGIIATFMLVEYYARLNLPTKNNEAFVFWNNCII